MDTFSPPTQTKRISWLWLGRIIALLFILGFLAEAVRVTSLSNRHTVIPGKIYRSAQPSDDDVREYLAEKNIKTIINLRGLSPEFDWYQGECRAASEAGIAQEDITLSANSLPPPQELKRLVEVLDRCEYPILIHCRRGADRTGLVSAMSLLLHTDAKLGEARRQLLVRYGHFRFGRTAAMDQFFDKYEASLGGADHTPERFRDWVLHRYCPGPARSKLEWVESFPDSVPAEMPRGFLLTATNHSDTTWELKPGTFAGVHVSYAVYDLAGKTILSSRTGHRLESVLPGGTTTIAIPLPGLPAGRYKLVAEWHDSTGGGIPFLTNSFVKFGDNSLVAELRVR